MSGHHPVLSLGRTLADRDGFFDLSVLLIGRGRVATERDEFRSAAQRAMVAAAVEPDRLLFVEECGLLVSAIGT